MEKQNKTLAKVFHFDLYGKREEKYDFLNESTINSVKWNELDYKEPYFFFVPKDFSLEKEYFEGFKLDYIFNLVNSGFETAKDNFLIKNNKTECDILKIDIENLNSRSISEKYSLKIEKSIEVKQDIETSQIIQVLYRPFDIRYTLFSRNSKGVMFRPRYETLKHLLKENVGLLCCKRQTSFDFQHTFITTDVVERCAVSLQTGEISYLFLLYLYPDKETEGVFAEEGLSEKGRKPNLNLEIIAEIEEKLNITFVPEKIEDTCELTIGATFAPIDILDYIYAVLHSPTYREKYKEFLKIDFPRVPYPENPEIFWQLVKLGGEIRQIHLLESPKVEEFITSYPIDGSNQITTKIAQKDWQINSRDRSRPVITGRIWINDQQYFDNIPLVAWEFYIGGYQPAQKWLKDRTGRTLSFDDILHYQKIIVALTETDRLMKEIDEIGVE